MQTTQLYVELVVIGIESGFCVVLALLNIFGAEKLKPLLEHMDSLASFGIALGVFYILGIIVDRFTDLIFYRYSEKVKKEEKLESTSSRIVFASAGKSDILVYFRSRHRILRSTIFNSLLATVLGTVYVLTKVAEHRLGLILFVLIAGAFTFITSALSYRKMTRAIYAEARVVELQEKKDKSEKGKGSQ